MVLRTEIKAEISVSKQRGSESESHFLKIVLFACVFGVDVYDIDWIVFNTRFLIQVFTRRVFPVSQTV